MGVKDAKKYYTGTYAGTAVFFQSLLGVGALYTCVVASNTPPNATNLLTDDYNKFKDKNYETGYKNAALKIKREKLWTNFAIGTFLKVSVAAVVFFVVK